jgi:DNA replicative helicase MCM subunit Mcm2 (Cdc46/Mcm family)
MTLHQIFIKKSFSCSFVDFMEMSMVAAHMLIKHPARLLPIFDGAICELQRKWLEDLPPTDPARKRWRVKPHCHARLTHLHANVPELWKTKLPRSSDVGNFVEVRGTRGFPFSFIYYILKIIK